MGGESRNCRLRQASFFPFFSSLSLALFFYPLKGNVTRTRVRFTIAVISIRGDKRKEDGAIYIKRGGSIEFSLARVRRGERNREREREKRKVFVNRFISRSRIITPSTANNKINLSLVKASVMARCTRASRSANIAVVMQFSGKRLDDGVDRKRRVIFLYLMLAVTASMLKSVLFFALTQLEQRCTRFDFRSYRALVV